VHRLAAGHSPLAGENALADLLIGRSLPLDPSLPDDVAEVLAKALQRDKTLRYDDAADFAAALGACMSRRLEEDPRSALRRWLASLRDEPAPTPTAGALDALLGLEWVVVGESEGLRTFAAHQTAATPGGTVVAGGTAVATTEVMAGGPEPRRGTGLVVLAVAVALGVLAFGGWSWVASRAEHDGVAVDSSGPSVDVVEGRTSSSGTNSTSESTGSPEAGEGTTDSTGRPRDEVTGGTTAVEAPDAGAGRPARTSPDRSRRPTRRASPPDAVGTGYLLIGGAGAHRAEIVVDGRRRGHAPRKIELSAGSHHVILRDQSGATLAERDVELRASHTRSAPFRWVVPG